MLVVKHQRFQYNSYASERSKTKSIYSNNIYI